MGCASSMVLPTETHTVSCHTKRNSNINNDNNNINNNNNNNNNNSSDISNGSNHGNTYTNGNGDCDVAPEISECDECGQGQEGPGSERRSCDHMTLSDIPQVYLNHVIGLDEEKGKIKEVLDTFIFNFDDFEGVGMTPTKGVLLYGPTGCGKSLLAEAFACKYALSFLSVHAAEITDTMVKDLLVEVKKCLPCVLLIKHIDFARKALNKKELKKSIGALIKQTLDTKERIFVFATAFKLTDCDTAYRTADRFETAVHIPKPSKEARLIKLRSLLCRRQNAKVNYKSLDYSKIADLTQGLTHTDLTKICEIAFTNLGVAKDTGSPEDIVVITKDDMLRAITEYCSIIQKEAMIDSPD